jgi:protein TonB
MAMAMFHSEGVYRVGGGVSVPRLLVNNTPEYTSEARGARIEGHVELVVTIGEDGIARDMRIPKPLGYGLDEKAIDCVSNWLFSPGLKNGEAVPVAANIAVHFSLQSSEEDPRAAVQSPTLRVVDQG